MSKEMKKYRIQIESDRYDYVLCEDWSVSANGLRLYVRDNNDQKVCVAIYTEWNSFVECNHLLQ